MALSGLVLETRERVVPAFPGRDKAVGTRQPGFEILAASAATLVAILLRWGYSFGYFDQTVLSVRGIALADPHALRGDWFTHSIPQPHWFFDIVTFVGERLGALVWVYLAYWIASVVVFGVAAVWVAERFLPGRTGAAPVIGVLAVLAPQAILGSSGPLVWFAIPTMLGGCLAFLVLSALLTDRFWVAVVGALLAGMVHVQHGANLAAVLLVAALISKAWNRKQRAVAAATGLALLAGAQAVATWRHIESGGQEWLEACREVIPYHCYAPSWNTPYLVSGGLVVLMAGAFIWCARDRLRMVVAAVALPTTALVVGVVAERFEWGILGRLAQMYNVHRLVALVVPFGAAGLLILGDRLARIRPTPLRRAGLGALGGVVVLLWSTSTENPFGHRFVDRPSLLAVILSLAVAVWIARPRATAAAGGGRFVLRPAVAVAVGVALLPAVLVGSSEGAFGRVGPDTSVGGIRAAVAIGRTVPETGVIAAPPEIHWLRLLSRRAVVADCKAGPYGGAAWHEYKRRLEALGGCGRPSPRFRGLSVDQIEGLRAKYGVTHVLLYGDDPKVGYARSHWRAVYDAGPQDSLYMQHGWTLFELESA